MWFENFTDLISETVEPSAQQYRFTGKPKELPLKFRITNCQSGMINNLFNDCYL